MATDKARSDMEHYVRLAQNVLDQAYEHRTKNIADVIRERPHTSESELLENFLSDASRLAHSFVELSAWLELRDDRKAGVLGTRRGRERLETGETVRTRLVSPLGRPDPSTGKGWTPL